MRFSFCCIATCCIRRPFGDMCLASSPPFAVPFRPDLQPHKAFLRDEKFFQPPFEYMKSENDQPCYYWLNTEDSDKINLHLQALCNEWGWALTVDGQEISDGSA